MLKNSFIGAVVLMLLVGCGNEPEPMYSVPLVQSDDERAELIAEHRAQPLKCPGYEAVYLAGPKEERQDCTRCHIPGKEPYRDESMPEGQDAHWDISVHHAGDMDCFSCHKKEDPTKLVSVIDKEASIETTYLHCGSCHTDQYKSWLGGAHGKRVTGWDGVRIIKNCTDCHDPHSPAHEKVLPVAQPTVIPDRAKRL